MACSNARTCPQDLPEEGSKVRKSHDKREWTRLPAARLFPNDDD